MEKAHYCERFLELMVDLEVTYHVCNSLNNYFEGKSCPCSNLLPFLLRNRKSSVNILWLEDLTNCPDLEFRLQTHYNSSRKCNKETQTYNIHGLLITFTVPYLYVQFIFLSDMSQILGNP